MNTMTDWTTAMEYENDNVKEYMELSEEEIEYQLELREHELEEMEKEPKLLFKYRAIVTAEDLARAIDILENNRLYMPTVLQLNDPFEGGNVDCMSEEENRKLEELRKTYRVLSLSEDCFAPTLWAYYAQETNGICIGFYKDSDFGMSQAVEYEETKDRKQWLAFEPSSAADREYLYKNLAWSHEKEHRICCEKDENYFQFEQSTFACLVLGDKIYEEGKSVAEVIIKIAKSKGIPIFILREDWNRSRYYVLKLGEEDKAGNRIYEIEKLLEKLKFCSE